MKATDTKNEGPKQRIPFALLLLLLVRQFKLEKTYILLQQGAWFHTNILTVKASLLIYFVYFDTMNEDQRLDGRRGAR